MDYELETLVEAHDRENLAQNGSSFSSLPCLYWRLTVMLTVESEPADGLHGDGEPWPELAVAGPQNSGLATNLIFFGQQRK